MWKLIKGHGRKEIKGTMSLEKSEVEVAMILEEIFKEYGEKLIRIFSKYEADRYKLSAVEGSDIYNNILAKMFTEIILLRQSISSKIKEKIINFRIIWDHRFGDEKYEERKIIRWESHFFVAFELKKIFKITIKYIIESISMEDKDFYKYSFVGVDVSESEI
jgi:hypothetical protein